MDITKILDQILSTTYTTHQLNKRLRLLKSFLSEKVFTNQESNKSFFDQADSKWLGSLSSDFFKNFTAANFQDIFKQLEEQTKLITPLIIYIPADLPEEEIAKLSTNLRQNYGQNTIMDIKLDPTLLAGCALVWKGVYKDYSLRAKIAEEKDQVLTVFKQYVK